MNASLITTSTTWMQFLHQGCHAYHSLCSSQFRNAFVHPHISLANCVCTHCYCFHTYFTTKDVLSLHFLYFSSKSHNLSKQLVVLLIQTTELKLSWILSCIAWEFLLKSFQIIFSNMYEKARPVTHCQLKSDRNTYS